MAETSLNPFYNFGEEDEDDDKAGLDTSSKMFAYSSNLSGMFEHLSKLNARRDSEADELEIVYSMDNPAFAPHNDRDRQREMDLDPIEE